MNYLRPVMIWGRVVIAIVPLVCCASDSRSDRDTEDEARALVALQAQSELGVWQRASGIRVGLDDVRLEVGPSLLRGVQIVRGIPPRDHWHSYLIAMRGAQLCPLGGFTSPDLDCITRWMGQSPPTGTALVDRARILATLADVNGAARVISLADTNGGDDPAVRDAWARRRPQNWPQDTLVILPAGDAVVRLTMLSQQTRSYEQAWLAVVYDFQFDANSNLQAWSRRVSDPFLVPGSQ